jgi:hypothetical protein
MRKLSAIAILAALSLPMAGVAYAEDAAVGAKGALKGAAAGATVGADVDATTTASVGSENYGTLISTLNAAKGTVDLSGIGADANISIVLVSKLQGGGDARALDNALSKNAAAMTSLQASLQTNAAIKAKLEADKLKIEDVVAVTTTADGMATVYVDDRA